MLLAIDIGNSSVALGIVDISDTNAPEIIALSRISLQKNRTADEYAVIMRDVLNMRLGDKSGDISIDGVAVSSVVPSVTPVISCAAKIITGVQPFIIGPGIHTGFRLAIDDPSTLGADIVANVSAALTALVPPMVIFDAGTANTLTLVDRDKSVSGIIIMPGLRISASSLHDSAELIDGVALFSNDVPLIGKNTEQSILSGLINGNAAMIDGLVRSIRESLNCKDTGEKLSLVATGEYARIIASKCRNKFTIDETLTLKGTATLYCTNRDRF